ncbi:MAG: alkaline phosphatase family protein, partial [Phaeodactylibacter sp.]|nr:alkaline phosphatase family protein [Phaeodactylibacter sp.]
MKQYLLLFFAGMAVFACRNQRPSAVAPVTTRIAFGSCAHQDKEQPLLKVAASLKPEVFLFLGDNIYGDSREMDTLRAKYARLAAKEEFQQLANQTRVLAVWDDHDYGENDSGRHYPFKAESKEIFMDFWKVPAGSDRRNHEGIYGVETLQTNGLLIQFILLDTRTFRDNLIKRDSADTVFKNDYAPNENPDSTFLGATQWQWLEEQLSTKADIRIIASSNQFSHAYNGWESWTNVPHERQRMIDLIKKTKANGVVFISGDVHWGELSKLEV